MSDQTVKALINIDFTVNEEIKSGLRLKRLNGETEEIKENVMGKMIQERHQLEKELEKKGWNFEELIYFINKKPRS